MKVSARLGDYGVIESESDRGEGQLGRRVSSWTHFSGLFWAPPRPLTTSTCQVSPIYSNVDPTAPPIRITSIHTHLGLLSELTGWQVLIYACASPPQVASDSVLATGVGTPEGAARQLLDRLW